MVRTFEEIVSRLDKGEAIVLTAQEISELVEEGDESTLREVDVVTTATRGIMSGTYALLSFQVRAPRIFTKAERVFINGVPAFVGPCPNERLGILDLIIFGTAKSETDPTYGAGHLFQDLVRGKSAEVEVRTEDGYEFSDNVSLQDMAVASLLASRNIFRNYHAFVNRSQTSVRSIFHAREFKPGLKEATFSGAGHISPLENDPSLKYIGIGTRVLVNGSEGFVIGTGTRSTPDHPNLMMISDMKGMNPEYMGGFKTSAGPECIVSWAVPIAVIDDSIAMAIRKRDADIPLPIVDIFERKRISLANYGEAWQNVDLAVKLDTEKCIDCVECHAAIGCPMDAINFDIGKPRIDRKKCFNCGFCTTLCPQNVFRAKLGKIKLPDNGIEIPIVCRQTDRLRSLRLAEELKKRILSNSFKITQKVESLRI